MQQKLNTIGNILIIISLIIGGAVFSVSQYREALQDAHYAGHREAWKDQSESTDKMMRRCEKKKSKAEALECIEDWLSM